MSEFEYSLNILLDVPEDYLFSQERLQEFIDEYKVYYEDLLKEDNARIANNILPPLYGNNHLEIYQRLLAITQCFENESYFENELLNYTNIKNNVSELSQWLNFHNEDKEGKISVFNMAFQDTREIINYRFSTVSYIEININPNGFKNTVRVLDIIERSKKIKLEGEIQELSEIEIVPAIYSNLNSSIIERPEYSRMHIILKSNNFQEYLIKFSQGKTELLNGVKVGDEITVFADIIGGKWDNGYEVHLIGWDVNPK